MSFTNTGAIAVGFAAPRTGDTVGNSWAPTERVTNQNNWVIDINDTSDLVPGMTISGQGIVPDATSHHMLPGFRPLWGDPQEFLFRLCLDGAKGMVPDHIMGIAGKCQFEQFPE